MKAHVLDSSSLEARELEARELVLILLTEYAKENLVELGKKISRNAYLLENNTYGPDNRQSLEGSIRYQLNLYVAIKSYLESEHHETHILEFILSMNFKNMPIMTALIVTGYFNCIIEVQSLKDVVESFNNDKFTESINTLLEHTKLLFSEGANFTLDEVKLKSLLDSIVSVKNSLKTKIN
jgi:hypothetical protein